MTFPFYLKKCLSSLNSVMLFAVFWCLRGVLLVFLQRFFGVLWVFFGVFEAQNITVLNWKSHI